MGIRDFFRRNKKEEQIDKNENKPDCCLSYRSGIEADINFTDLEQIQLDNGTIKVVQSVSVMYNLPDGTFQRNQYYVEPVFDKEGNNITKESYVQLVDYNKPLIKGFFAKEQLDRQATNYIGYIDYDENRKPKRGKDVVFEREYKTMQNRIKEEKDYQRKIEDDKFKQELLSKVNEKGFEIKTSHAEYLGDKEFVNPHRNNNHIPYR